MWWSSAVVLGLLHSFPVFVDSKPLESINRRWDDLVEKHSWVDVPQGWSFETFAPQDYIFDLRIGLKPTGMDQLIADLMEISDPSHDRYAQHLSKAEVADFMTPHSSSVEAVESWLSLHTINRTSVGRVGVGGEWVTLRLSVAEAERMLGAKYHIFHNSASGQRVVRTLAYSLPRELHRHIDVVAPTTYFSTLQSMRATNFLQPEIEALVGDPVVLLSDPTGAIPGSCETRITPACLRALYKTKDYKPVSTDKNEIGIAGYLNEFASYSDLGKFFDQFRPEAEGSSFVTVQVNGGGNDQDKPGIEANLDIQYTTAMTFPTANTYYSTGGSPPIKPDSFTPTNTNEPYLDWLDFILTQDTIPQVISTSYGDNEQTVPKEYAETVCKRLAILGARGTTVLFSSGDYGVGGGDCKTNDGTDTTLFQPSFPASCPFVTTVGGTISIPEVAVNFSGGGFSRYFPQPSYQKGAVDAYLYSLNGDHEGLFNRSGRAYPDVAAQASGFQVVIGGKVQSIGGTSASCPIVASVFTLLNDYRLSLGKRSLGFINPLLYSQWSTGFNDIVAGRNPGCGTTGFSAGKGWDPVTGLGTPDFLKLKELAEY